jgi:energy-converting hydrogenase Eha subunit E
MRRVNPILAAILNFIVPGLGFIYIGKRLLIVVGLILISISAVGAMFNSESLTVTDLIISITYSVIMALLAYIAAKKVNMEQLNRFVFVNRRSSRRYLLIPPPPGVYVVYCRWCGYPNPSDAGSLCIKCGRKLFEY